MEISLKGRSAIITGASKGLGLAMATEFAASGADVANLARNPDGLEQAKAVISATAKGKVAGFACDVSKAEDVRRGYEAAMAAFGKIDIMVNNAGISRAMAFDQVTDEMWQDDLELKLFAAIRFCRLVMPQMKQRRWGRVINVLNIGAKAPKANSTPTSVSRAAGMALTKALSHEGAAHNVLVNAMLVGQIASDQWVRRHKAAADAGSNESFDDYAAKLGAPLPLKRIGKAEEFAALACFLCSEQAGYITGTAINVDGGASPVM